MAKNIKIKQNGVASNYNNAKMLNTNDIDYGSTNWIPRDEILTKVKIITENGTYKAVDEGFKGYTVVCVNVSPTQVTGVDVRDGKTYVVTIDENGYIVRTLVDE